jgi:hypothetical protein
VNLYVATPKDKPRFEERFVNRCIYERLPTLETIGESTYSPPLECASRLTCGSACLASKAKNTKIRLDYALLASSVLEKDYPLGLEFSVISRLFSHTTQTGSDLSQRRRWLSAMRWRALDSVRRHGLAAVETVLAEVRTDQYAHGLQACCCGWDYQWEGLLSLGICSGTGTDNATERR